VTRSQRGRVRVMHAVGPAHPQPRPGGTPMRSRWCGAPRAPPGRHPLRTG